MPLLNRVYGFPTQTEIRLGGEVVAIGTCLQLVVVGVAMTEQWLDSSDELKAILQALKDRKRAWHYYNPESVNLLT